MWGLTCRLKPRILVGNRRFPCTRRYTPYRLTGDTTLAIVHDVATKQACDQGRHLRREKDTELPSSTPDVCPGSTFFPIFLIVPLKFSIDSIQEFPRTALWRIFWTLNSQRGNAARGWFNQVGEQVEYFRRWWNFREVEERRWGNSPLGKRSG